MAEKGGPRDADEQLQDARQGEVLLAQDLLPRGAACLVLGGKYGVPATKLWPRPIDALRLWDDILCGGGAVGAGSSMKRKLLIKDKSLVFERAKFGIVGMHSVKLGPYKLQILNISGEVFLSTPLFYWKLV